ncbi:glycine cleavage system H lipoate-binding protein [Kitasatospora sp. MAA19]|uniref:glycine cleavage system protein H n=1 Tax=Kitasatospora sp. MAA19 TaxID=3035090 RepID=UPI0024740DD5|nr:hypothetical protein [Kitasatospora sp. MAA19]MDH6704703.1 glycine cleavage system H lipoate-binding protein [Kitasatospora sp. MAA19]
MIRAGGPRLPPANRGRPPTADVPKDLKCTRDHAWVRPLGSDWVRVGITDHAQRQLGDIVYVELPKAGARFETSEPFGGVE